MKKFFLFFASALVFVPVFAWENEEVEHECTSWMVFKDFTKNNTNILHKNRDSKEKRVAAYMSPAGAKRKWVAIGTINLTNTGVNASGLAGAMNSGEKTPDAPNAKDKKSTPALLLEILNSCDTAAQAVKKLEKLVKSGDYYHADSGSTFLFMDTKEGYICEFTTKFFTAQRFDNAYAFRANIWQNHGMPARARGSYKSYLHSSARAYIALAGLNQALDKHGKITVADIAEISRVCQIPGSENKSWFSKLFTNEYPNRAVCGQSTNSGTTIEIDIQYPDVLSSIYAAIGNPRNTVYIPIPICAEKYLPSMGNYSWSLTSYKRAEKEGFEAPIPAEWQKFEADSMAKYAAAKADARKLLDNGKRAEAVKLLNDTAYKIWEEAEALLNIQTAGK